MTDDRFASAFRKLARGDEHRETLESDVLAYRALDVDDRYRLRREDNLDKGDEPVMRADWYFEEVTPFPPAWGPLLGDCLHNYRCALDHTIWALSTKPKKEHLVAFPIFLTEVGFDGNWHMPLSGVDATVRAL